MLGVRAEMICDTKLAWDTDWLLLCWLLTELTELTGAATAVVVVVVVVVAPERAAWTAASI